MRLLQQFVKKKYVKCVIDCCVVFPQIEQKIEDMFTTRVRVTDINRPMINQQVTPSASNQEKLELAKRLAARVNMKRNLGDQAQDVTQQAAAAIWKGGIAAPAVSVSCHVCNYSSACIALASCGILNKMVLHVIRDSHLRSVFGCASTHKVRFTSL